MHLALVEGPYCLAWERSRLASILKPPPPGPLWNSFIAALGGLLEKAPGSFAQAEADIQTAGSAMGAGGRERWRLEARLLASGKNEAPAQTVPPLQALLSFVIHTVSAYCVSSRDAGHRSDPVQTLPFRCSQGQRSSKNIHHRRRVLLSTYSGLLN